ncbi:MAG: hypothetical protein AB1571_01305 [Nanoarchaeota archaeon]
MNELALEEVIKYIAVGGVIGIVINLGFNFLDNYAKRLGRRDFISRLNEYSKFLKECKVD